MPWLILYIAYRIGMRRSYPNRRRPTRGMADDTYFAICFAHGVMLAVLIGLSVLFAHTGVVSWILAILCLFVVSFWMYSIGELVYYRHGQQVKGTRH